MLSIVKAIGKKISDFAQTVKRNTDILMRLLPILSFIIPFILLYYLHPSSFEETWKGRTYYLFFIWLVFLETILSWEELQIGKINKLDAKRTAGLIILLLLPTLYVRIADFLNPAIEHLYLQYMGVGYEWWAHLMPLSIEYFVFGVMFISIQVITHGKKGLTNFSISTSLLFAIGTFYIIDNFYPYGRIAPLQYAALPTTTLAANVLSLMGYQTKISIGTDPYYGWMPILSAWDPKNPMKYATFGIGWPCAGVESLLLYTITILLFLKKSNISLKQRVVYFMFGAIVTYFINILRIATIFVIAINTGAASLQTQRFHEYYGPLYSIIWIISYPLIMIGSRALWREIKNRRARQMAKLTSTPPVTPSFKLSIMWLYRILKKNITFHNRNIA